MVYPGQVVLGRAFHYRFTVSNRGPEEAPVVVFTHRVPEGIMLVEATPVQGTCSGVVRLECNLGALAVGAVAEITVSGIAWRADRFVVGAYLGAHGVDPQVANNTLSATLVAVPAAASADLELGFTDAPGAVEEGDLLTYAVSVRNNGPVSAAEVILRLSVTPLDPASFVAASTPQGRCNRVFNRVPLEVSCALGSLASGASVRVTLAVRAEVAAAEVLRAVATVDSATADPNRDNNEAQAVTDVVAEPLLGLDDLEARSGCFIIATARGSTLTAELDTFREFRDRYLLTHGPGQALVRAYYAYSPAVADFLRQHEMLRTAMRWVLQGLAAVLRQPLLAGAGVLLVGSGYVVGRLLRRRIRARRTTAK